MSLSSISSVSHGYGSVRASAYLVEKVSGSRSDSVLQKTFKIVPTAALFGADHIKVKVRVVITFSRLNLPGMDFEVNCAGCPWV